MCTLNNFSVTYNERICFCLSILLFFPYYLPLLTAFLQQSPYPPYHGVPRDYRMAMVGQSFPIMGSSLYRGYTKPNRQTANSARHAEKSKSKVSSVRAAFE